ncbi:MAG: hypothetical protein R6W99_01265 [Clostridia bacterium]
MKSMKIKSLSVVIVIILLLAVPLSGCRRSEDDLNERLAEELAENYAKGITGGNVDLDLGSGNEWPEAIPDNVPEFKKGTIETTSSLKIGEQTQTTAIIADVPQEDFQNYLDELADSGFEQVVYQKSGNLEILTYSMGENMISMQYDSRALELMFTYTGNN